MKRRDFLGLSALLAGSLAGCTGSGGSGSAPPTSPTASSTETPSSTPPPADPIPIGSREDVAFPENNRPRGVVVTNDSEQPWDVQLELTAVDAGKVLWSQSQTFGPDERIGLRLLTPASYDLTVAVEVGATKHVEIPVSAFDCNHATTTARIGPTGGVSTRTVSTAVGCPSAALTGTSLSSAEGSCGGSDRAAISFGPDGVRVDGGIVAPTPCHDVRVRDTSFSDGVLTVTLETVSTDGACVQCLATIPYKLDCGFDQDLPAEVVVRHRRQGEAVAVARERRGADVW